jgi:hypothetical protein
MQCYRYAPSFGNQEQSKKPTRRTGVFSPRKQPGEVHTDISIISHMLPRGYFLAGPGFDKKMRRIIVGLYYMMD